MFMEYHDAALYGQLRAGGVEGIAKLLADNYPQLYTEMARDKDKLERFLKQFINWKEIRESEDEEVVKMFDEGERQSHEKGTLDEKENQADDHPQAEAESAAQQGAQESEEETVGASREAAVDGATT